MAHVIERKQNELDSLAQRMQIPIDTDILKMRLAKDLEQKYRFELDNRLAELERATDSLFETKRQLDLIKITYESSRHENEKFLSDMRDRHKQEID
jgi:hypothetical protein